MTNFLVKLLRCFEVDNRRETKQRKRTLYTPQLVRAIAQEAEKPEIIIEFSQPCRFDLM